MGGGGGGGGGFFGGVVSFVSAPLAPVMRALHRIHPGLALGVSIGLAAMTGGTSFMASMASTVQSAQLAAMLNAFSQMQQLAQLAQAVQALAVVASGRASFSQMMGSLGAVLGSPAWGGAMDSFASMASLAGAVGSIDSLGDLAGAMQGFMNVPGFADALGPDAMGTLSQLSRAVGSLDRLAAGMSPSTTSALFEILEAATVFDGGFLDHMGGSGVFGAAIGMMDDPAAGMQALCGHLMSTHSWVSNAVGPAVWGHMDRGQRQLMVDIGAHLATPSPRFMQMVGCHVSTGDFRSAINLGGQYRPRGGGMARDADLDRHRNSYYRTGNSSYGPTRGGGARWERAPAVASRSGRPGHSAAVVRVVPAARTGRARDSAVVVRPSRADAWHALSPVYGGAPALGLHERMLHSRVAHLAPPPAATPMRRGPAYSASAWSSSPPTWISARPTASTATKSAVGGLALYMPRPSAASHPFPVVPFAPQNASGLFAPPARARAPMDVMLRTGRLDAIAAHKWVDDRALAPTAALLNIKVPASTYSNAFNQVCDGSGAVSAGGGGGCVLPHVCVCG
jgi:hypothetical protein